MILFGSVVLCNRLKYFAPVSRFPFSAGRFGSPLWLKAFGILELDFSSSLHRLRFFVFVRRFGSLPARLRWTLLLLWNGYFMAPANFL